MHNTIKDLREAKGMSQEQLATAAGLSRPYLSTIETGAAVPTVAKAASIASALGCSLDDLFPAQFGQEAQA